MSAPRNPFGDFVILSEAPGAESTDPLKRENEPHMAFSGEVGGSIDSLAGLARSG